jgi:uncharacterized membrane protein YebE (DUF533 family)
MARAEETQILSVIRVWAAVAWADGVMAEAEADGLRRLIKGAELSPEEKLAAAKFVDASVDLPERLLHDLEPAARRGVYRAACKVAVVDHVFARSERSMLDRLRTHLGIPADIAMEIEADIPGLAAPVT